MFCFYKEDFTDIQHFKFITFPAEPEQQKLIKRIVVIRFIHGYISNFIAFGVIILLSTSRGIFNDIDFSVSYFISVVINRFHGLHMKYCIKKKSVITAVFGMNKLFRIWFDLVLCLLLLAFFELSETILIIVFSVLDIMLILLNLEANYYGPTERNSVSSFVDMMSYIHFAPNDAAACLFFDFFNIG